MAIMSGVKKTNTGQRDTIAYRVASGGILIVLAFMFSYLETLFPAAPGLPGVKLGLANLVIIFTLYRINPGMAWMVNIIRIILSGFIFSGLYGILYSIAGGILSLLTMTLMKKSGKFSVIGVSMGGSVSHNFGQVAVAVFLTGTRKIFYYFPVLILTGTAAGILIGIAAVMVLKRLPGGSGASFNKSEA